MKFFIILKNLWLLLDGHKTQIGGFIAGLYSLLIEFNVIQQNGFILKLISIIFGVGITHKSVKFVKETM